MMLVSLDALLYDVVNILLDYDIIIDWSIYAIVRLAC